MRAVFALILRFLIGGGLAALALLAVAVLEPAPRVDAPEAPRQRDARVARDLATAVQEIRRAPDGQGVLVAEVRDIDGLFRILHRAHPGLRGRARLEEGRLVIEASAALWPDAGLGQRLGLWPGWLNLTAEVPPFAEGLTVEGLRLGRLPLPPGPALAALAWALDRRLGADSFARLLEAAPTLRIEGEELRLAVDMTGLPTGNVARLTVGDAYGRSMPSRAEVAAHVAAFSAAAAEGQLPATGSFMPWLRMMIDRVAAEAGDDPERALIGGLMALNYLCGSDQFLRFFIPPRGEDEAPLPPRTGVCDRVTLRGLVDKRRHFLTAATLRAVSERGPAVVTGEAKELHDSIRGFFDFTDIAANNSGIRFAALMLAMPPEDWPALRDRIAADGDVLIPLDGIPGEMRREAFRARFGGLDSPAYAAMLDEIETRIDALPIHAASGGG